MDVDKLVPEAGSLTGFIEQFPVFANAPNGINELKGLIIKLAVIGSIGTNNEDDSSADIALSEYRRKLNQEVKAANFPKRPILKNILQSEIPFKLPTKWTWFRFGELMDIQGGSQPPKSFFIDEPKKDYTQLIQIRDLGPKPQPIYVPVEKVTKFCSSDDILIGRYGASVGKVFWGKDGAYNVALIKILFLKDLFNSRFLHLYLRSRLFQDKILGVSRSAQSGFNKGDVHPILVPFPPLEEQKRIVAKVDELMALCDKLEAQQQQQANNVLRANTAAINALLNPEPQQTAKNKKTSATDSASEPKDSFEKNWQRIAQHFNTLYGCTLPMPKGEGRKKKHLVGLENVKALRQAILKLSVKGKLTQTQPEDGSSEELLEIINTEIDPKKYKKLNRLAPPKELFTLPHKWVWSSFWKIADIQSNLVKPDLYGDMPHIAPNHIEKDNGVLLEYSTVLADGVKSNKHYFYAGQILYSKIRPNLNKLTLIDFEGLCSADMYPIRAKINTNFLCLYMLSSYFVEQTVADDNRVAMPKVNQERLNSISVPVPPLEEQKRIVTKVDQLMTLCDQLEQQLTQSYSDAEKLMQATVKSLVA